MVEPCRLTGVGVGPGDPELLTLRGLAELGRADLVLVPASDQAADGNADRPAGHAERVVLAHLPDAPIERVPFALTERDGLTARRTSAWDAAAAHVLRAFDSGHRRVAFATVGDPNVYATFGYLGETVRARRPDVDIATVPGITAMQALAAATGRPLCEGREPLALLPCPDDLDAVLHALPESSVVLYKSGRSWPAVRDVLTRHGRLDAAVVGVDLGRPGQRVAAAADVQGELPYFSAVLAAPGRTTRGGKLR